MKNYLITGANKGIGYEMVRQLSRKGHRVFMACRSKLRGAEALNKLCREGLDADLIVMDVSNPDSIHNAFKEVQNEVDVLHGLVNNAAIISPLNQRIIDSPSTDLENILKTNSTGAFHTTQSFLPLLKPGSKVVNISSGLGSLDSINNSYAPAYSLSKILLNIITRQLAINLIDQDVYINAVCPGWVRTDMGGSNADRSVEEAVITPLWLLSEQAPNWTGKFVRDKQIINW